MDQLFDLNDFEGARREGIVLLKGLNKFYKLLDHSFNNSIILLIMIMVLVFMGVFFEIGRILSKSTHKCSCKYQQIPQQLKQIGVVVDTV